VKRFGELDGIGRIDCDWPYGIRRIKVILENFRVIDVGFDE
jgi:hypothetical protein